MPFPLTTDDDDVDEDDDDAGDDDALTTRCIAAACMVREGSFVQYTRGTVDALRR